MQPEQPQRAAQYPAPFQPAASIWSPANASGEPPGPQPEASRDVSTPVAAPGLARPPGDEVMVTPLTVASEEAAAPEVAPPAVRVVGAEPGRGFTGGWGVPSEPQEEETQKAEPPLAQCPIVSSQRRKFRDIACLVIFLAFWALVVYILVQAKVVTNLRRAFYVVQPGDGFRRLCATSAEDQPDVLAVDYSPVISTADELVGFCELAVAPEAGHAGLHAPAGGCSSLLSADGTPNTRVSAPFLREVGALYRDMSDYKYGLLVVRQTVCLTEAQAAFLGAEALCQPPFSAAYAVDREFSGFSRALGAVLPPGEFDFQALRPPYLTGEEYNGMASLLLRPEYSKYAFLLNFAHRIADPPSLGGEGAPPLSTVPRPDYVQFPPQETQEVLRKLGADVRFCMRNYVDYSSALLRFDERGQLVVLDGGRGGREGKRGTERSGLGAKGEEVGGGSHLEPPSPDHSLGLSASSEQRAWKNNPVFDYYQSFFADVVTGAAIEIKAEWGWIVGGVALSFVLSLAYILIMRCCVSFLVWAAILGTIGVITYGGVAVILMGLRMREAVEFSASAFGYNDFISRDNASILIALGAILCGVAGIIVLVVICMLGAISVAVGVVKAASQALLRLLYVVLLPLLFLVFAALHLAWMLVACFLFFATGRYDEKHNTYRFSEYVYDDAGMVVGVRTNPLQWTYFAVLVFAALWGAFFIWHCLSYLVSSVISQWYFTEDGSRGPGFTARAKPVRKAWGFLVKNTGTVAATSFIVSIVVYVRWVFEFMLRRMQKTAQSNALTRCLVCYVRCCLKCLETLVKYLSRNVLVYAGICGAGFIQSCAGAVGLLASHLRRVVAVNLMGKAYVFMGKLFAALASAVIVGLCIAYLENSMYYLVPSLLVFVFGFLVSYYLMSMVSLTIDSVFLCYLYEDVKLSSSRAEGAPSYAPAGLARLLE